MLQPTKHPCTSSIAQMTTQKPLPRKKTGTFEQACSDHKRWFCHKVLISLDGTDGHQELAAQSREIEQLREASTIKNSQTNSLCKDLRKAKEKLQTKPGFLHQELGITQSRLMDTKQELEEAQQDLKNAHRELENSQQELRNAQWVLEFTWQQVRTPPPCPIEGTTTSSTAPEWIILSP
ncbi:hypothetical protein EI94DRAFT_1700565 [Lactarius quietus]|nr:hypothetical protein EI94DRAFT_1700565 [Lactarius quietus]